MDDKQYKKLRFVVAVTWFLLLAVIILNIFLMTYKSGRGQLAYPIPGEKGEKGEIGPKGDRGEVGPVAIVPIPATIPPNTSPSISIQPMPNTVISPISNFSPAAVIGPKGDSGASIQGTKGEAGEKGDPGPAGREIELQTNNLTGDIEWRYIGDDLWTVLMKNCKIKGECP